MSLGALMTQPPDFDRPLGASPVRQSVHMAIGRMSSHFAIISADVQLLEEKFAMGYEMTPVDRDELDRVIASADLIASRLYFARHGKAIVAENTEAELRVVRESIPGADVSADDFARPVSSVAADMTREAFRAYNAIRAAEIL